MRVYKKKTNRGETPKELMEEAINRVLQNNETIRSVANDLNICHVTLSRYVKKVRQNNEDALKDYGYSKHKQVFSDTQLDELVSYIKHCSKIYFGLSPKEVRRFAYDCAVAFHVAVPESWRRDNAAGEDWLTSFLKKHPTLSIRTPEATSIGRATNFNKPNVDDFFNKLAAVRDKFGFTASEIWNLDETGLTTVQRLGKIVAQKGIKQVGGITSSERGVLVTMCIAVNAIGNHVPPMFLFPRKRFHDHFIRDGPPGCIGAGNGSGWMTQDEFYIFMQHFVSHVRPNREKPVLLLLDNHDSHTAYKTVKYAKDNGVVLLSFPPHCSHRLQPLDRSVYGPLKKYMTSAQDAWMRNNPGKSMTIYDLPGLAREALPLALAPNNVIKGFNCTGIEPFNRNIFTEDDFLPASVTDRPEVHSSQTDVPDNSSGSFIVGPQPQKATSKRLPEATSTCSDPSEPPKQAPIDQLPVASLSCTDLSDDSSISKQVPTNQLFVATSTCSEPSELSALKQASMNQLPAGITVSSEFNTPSTSKQSATVQLPEKTQEEFDKFSPELIRPFPSAAHRKESTRGRKKRKSSVLTDTPELDVLKSEAATRLSKKNKLPATRKEKLKNVKKKILQDSSDEDDAICIVCCDNFSNSKSKEIWIQCVQCKQWAHEACTPNGAPFLCHHCDSDDD